MTEAELLEATGKEHPEPLVKFMDDDGPEERRRAQALLEATQRAYHMAWLRGRRP
jgi:hypothetical protein